MNRVSAIILLSLGLFLQTGYAANVSLFVYQENPDAPQFILPRLDSETPRQALLRYIDAVVAETGLASLFSEYGTTTEQREFRQRLKNMAAQAQTSELPSSAGINALLSNSLFDMSADIQNADPVAVATEWRYRMHRAVNMFNSFGINKTRSFSIPLVSDIHLNEQQKQQYRQLIAENVNVLVAMGGDDLHVDLYNGSEQDRRNMESGANLFRDRSEYALVKHFKEQAPNFAGIFIGICRGHQLGGFADGHRLNSNIISPTINHRATNGGVTWHSLNLADEALAQFLARTESFQEYLRTNDGRLIVNSFHHQAVIAMATAASVPYAIADDGTVEILIGRNLLSFSFQFHPEFQTAISENEFFSALGRRILRRIVAYSMFLQKQQAERARATSPAAQALQCENIFH